MSALKLIHLGRRELGLTDDDDYRDVLEQVTGKRSAKAMTERERRAVVDEFRRRGFRLQRSANLTGPYAGKLVALWLSAWNLGIVRNRTDAALIAFVERQTGIAHMNWLRDARDARRAIEALKAWIAREAGVEWPSEDDGRSAKLAVIAAQLRKLEDGPLFEVAAKSAAGGHDNLDVTIAELGARIRKAAA